MKRKINGLLAMTLLTGAAANSALGAIYTVDKTGILNPNPNNIATIEVGNTGLTAARALVAAANTAGTGGVLDFQQRAQGGTFPNSAAPDNGLDFANGAQNPLYVTNGATGDGLVGTPFFSFYRLESTGTNDGVNPPTNGVNNFDSNLNQGGNVISGGFSSRYPGPVSATNPLGDGTTVTGVNPAYAPGITVSIGGGYLGINNQATPATMVFSNPLSFFGLTGLPRGATRDTRITLTLVDLVTSATSTVTIDDANNSDLNGDPTQTVVPAASAVFFGYTAAPGLGITQAAISNPNGQGQNRYDDFAFVLVPEPTSVAVLGLGAIGLVARRRRI